MTYFTQRQAVPTSIKQTEWAYNLHNTDRRGGGLNFLRPLLNANHFKATSEVCKQHGFVQMKTAQHILTETSGLALLSPRTIMHCVHVDCGA